MVDGISSSKPTPSQAPSAAASSISGGAVEGSRSAKLPRPVAMNLPETIVSREASGLARDMAAKSPVDTARVADVKARIDTGTFRLEPERIADAMIAHERGAPKAR